jgi:hypothetical protein
LSCQLAVFSAYRTDQYAEPEGFKTSLGAVLEQYPDEVIIHVCDPRSGIQRRSKFPPSISEIVKECDDHVAWLAKVERFKNWGKQPKEIEPPREDRPTITDLKAKYGENWGLTSLDEPAKTAKPAPSWDQIAEHYRARPGRIQWLADRLSVLRGEAEDTPEPK